MTTFHTICLACIIIGIAIPFCSIVLNLFDGFADFVSIDLFHLDFGADVFLDFLPISINSLCIWALLFGAVGILFESSVPMWLLIIIGLLVGYIAAVILQTMIRKLKKVENFAADKEEVLLREAKVSNYIPKNGVGAVSVEVSTGSTLSYPAKTEDGEAIEQDKKVNILRFEGDYVIVKSVTYLEEKYENSSK